MRGYKWNAHTEEKVLQAIALGATYRHAASFAGISEDTLKRRRDSDASFAERLTRTRDEQAVLYLSAIDKAAVNGEWRAALAKLRLMYPREYSERLLLAGDADAPLHTIDDTDVAAKAIRDDPGLSARFADLMADVAARRERTVGPHVARSADAGQSGRPAGPGARDRKR